jgi:mono/diheme cytochrome c family protein
MRRNLTILLAMLVIGCGERPEEDAPAAESSLEWMEEHADDYLADTAWRRDQMEQALWRPELPYARKRLSGYARDEGGWDLLPEIDPQTSPVVAPEVETVFGPRPISTERPSTREEWLALGEDVFWHMPMRAAPYLQWLAEQPELWDEVGLERNEDGTVRGLARFRTARGEEAVGATCGLCHGNGGVAGKAAPDLDLGRARALFTQQHGGKGDNFDSWPSGTIDVTDDGVTDPVAIPDLWSVEHNSHLNASGVIEMTTPAALAVRLETQYIVGHSLESRPSRVQVWALTMYVLSLEYESKADVPEAGEGREVFQRACASCHRPDRAFAGDLVGVGRLTSDPLAAHSKYRGTGHYKVPSLVGISAGGPYLHDNSAADLPALLDEHPYELQLTSGERKALLSFLGTL